MKIPLTLHLHAVTLKNTLSVQSAVALNTVREKKKVIRRSLIALITLIGSNNPNNPNNPNKV